MFHVENVHLSMFVCEYMFTHEYVCMCEGVRYEFSLSAPIISLKVLFSQIMEYEKKSY